MRRTILFFFVYAALAIAAGAQTLSSVEARLVEDLNGLEKYSNYGGEYNGEELAKFNDKMRADVLKFAKRSDVLGYKFPKLDGKMLIRTSRDGRLRTYSWDTNQGGTMHDFVVVYQYRTPSGRIGAWTDDANEESGGGAFVNEIFQMDRTGGTVYMVVSSFVGSTSLGGQRLTTMTIGAKALNTPKLIRTKSGVTDSVGFEYDFFSAVDHPERPVKLFHWDARSKSFRFPVVVEDQKTPQGRVTDKFITYRFNGREFTKVG